MHWNTVSSPLEATLRQLMAEDCVNAFRLVGGTALSLHLGHRMSVDIDLFTDAEYDSINFSCIHNHLTSTYPYVFPG